MPDEKALQAQLAELALRRAAEIQNALDHPEPAPAPARLTPQAQRIIDLNKAAAAYYSEQLPTSWAFGYLHQRLGDPTHAPLAGYAPRAWTALTDHLRQQLAATDEELLAAGLARVSRRGTLIDTFRDRLILPLTDTHGIVGFVARRNPTRDDDPAAGPKYLNTDTSTV